MSPVDQYIRRATTGLPGRARLDTAAELRVHLNERIGQYMEEGFARAEAEHLAVQQMGPAEPVNRRFLGHVFTARVGWVVLAVLVVGLVGWVGANYLFAPAAVAEKRTITFEELVPFLGDFASVKLTLPKGTKTLYQATSLGAEGSFHGGRNLEFRVPELRPNQRLTEIVNIGFLNPVLMDPPCEEGTRALVTVEGSIASDAYSSSRTCVPLPSDHGSFMHLTQNWPDLELDTWLPVLLYTPSLEVEELAPGQRSRGQVDGRHLVNAPRDTWILHSVYPSSRPLAESSEVPPAPTTADLVALYPWLTF